MIRTEYLFFFKNVSIAYLKKINKKIAIWVDDVERFVCSIIILRNLSSCLIPILQSKSAQQGKQARILSCHFGPPLYLGGPARNLCFIVSRHTVAVLQRCSGIASASPDVAPCSLWWWRPMGLLKLSDLAQTGKRLDTPVNSLPVAI